MGTFYVRTTGNTIANAREIGEFVGKLLVSAASGPVRLPMASIGRIRASVVSELESFGILEYDKKRKTVRLISQGMWHEKL